MGTLFCSSPQAPHMRPQDADYLVNLRQHSRSTDYPTVMPHSRKQPHHVKDQAVVSYGAPSRRPQHLRPLLSTPALEPRRNRAPSSTTPAEGLVIATDSEENETDDATLVPTSMREELLETGADLMSDVLCTGLRPRMATFRLRNKQCVSRAVDYFLNIFAPSQKTLQAAFTSSSSQPYVLSSIFPVALEHQELFYAIVCLSQSLLESKESSSFRPSTDVLYHRQLALTSLRSKLLPPVCTADDAAILTAILLLTVDSLMGDNLAHEVHCHGLREMVMARGGVRQVNSGGPLGHLLSHCEITWAPESRAQQRISDNPPSPVICHDATTPIIPSGFHELALTNALSLRLLHIIARLSLWIECLTRVWTGTATAQDQAYLATNSPYADTYEANNYLQRLETSDPHAESIETYVCLALFLYSMYADLSCRHKPLFQHRRRQLTDLLLDYIDPEDVPDEHHEVMVWVHLVAVESWKVGVALFPAGEKLMQALCKLEPKANSWPYVEDVLKSFLWYEALAAKWEGCWDAGLDRWRGELRKFSVCQPENGGGILRELG